MKCTVQEAKSSVKVSSIYIYIYMYNIIRLRVNQTSCFSSNSNCYHTGTKKKVITNISIATEISAILVHINHLTPELIPSTQRCLPRFLLGKLIFKELTARCRYKSFGFKVLNPLTNNCPSCHPFHSYFTYIITNLLFQWFEGIIH
jgi:hypothetical protein